jgi:hypothetical protein
LFGVNCSIVQFGLSLYCSTHWGFSVENLVYVKGDPFWGVRPHTRLPVGEGTPGGVLLSTRRTDTRHRWAVSVRPEDKPHGTIPILGTTTCGQDGQALVEGG